MRSATYDLTISSARADALFASPLQRSDEPSPVMATKFGGQMMQAALENSLTRPGGVIVGGVPIDPSQITVDTYVLGASTDHISPWRDCYRTIAMIGGDATFVLANGGHAIGDS
jgi:poly(3-hydroxyalkanoate) synthetase